MIDLNQFNHCIDEMLIGISKSWIDKGVVSCGVHPQEKALELCQVLNEPEKFLNPDQVKNLNSLHNLHQKAWYCTLLLPIHHPYSLVFLRRENDFWKKHLQSDCEWTENSKHFPKTIEFINKLPFEQIGRVLFFITEPHQNVLTHYDGGAGGSRDRQNTEMIYFRPLSKKKLFIFDEKQDEKILINSTASYWNDMDWHGALPTETKSFSLRVDGIFTEQFRQGLEAFSKEHQ